MSKDLMSIVSAVVDRKREAAVERIAEGLRSLYGETVQNLQLDHVDAAGFWFSYNLTNDKRRQVGCIRPWEV